MSRDYGFAPNPFGHYCTLATCKPRIRKSANVDDWIFGISPKKMNYKLIYAMKVMQKITYNDYWDNLEFQYKKPLMNGSLKQMYGDNIYHFDEESNIWYQANSHHSLDNGVVNEINLKNDTQGQYVLISEKFYYFGSNCIELPKGVKSKLIIGRNHKMVNEKAAMKLIDLLESNYELGYIADPILFKDFQRYDGK